MKTIKGNLILHHIWFFDIKVITSEHYIKLKKKSILHYVLPTDIGGKNETVDISDIKDKMK